MANKIIIGVVILLMGGFFTLMLHRAPPVVSAQLDPCRMDNELPPFTCFEHCYDEQAVPHSFWDAFSPPPRDKSGLPMGWHMQLAVFLSSQQQSPKDLPADILALPDLSGLRDIPNLRVVMSLDDDLFIAVKALAKMQPLAPADPKVREAVRDILFAWVGVDKVPIGSRGLFIDARELAFLEKVTGESFTQEHNFPNPFPIAATAVKEIFDQTLDFYAAELVARIKGGPASPPPPINLLWEAHYDQGRTWLQWKDYNGRRVWFHGYYNPDMMKRRVCYSYIKD